MAEHVKLCFSESEQDHLRCLVRLTIEFNSYIQSFDADENDLNGLRYSIESILSGVESFCSVAAAYKVLVGAERSRVKPNTLSTILLKEQFASMFQAFNTETNFIKKCRLLLDLFKLQIVFVGVFYD